MFQTLVELLFAWLPPALYIPVSAIIGVAFLILIIKILTALVTVISKLIFLFV